MGAKGSEKTGGRQKGSPNKNTRTLLERAESLKVDPFEILLRFAKGDWKGLGYKSATTVKITKAGDVVEIDVIEPDLRVTAAKAACEYLHPKRKAIELSSNEDSPLEIYLRMSPEERARRREQLEKRLGKKG